MGQAKRFIPLALFLVLGGGLLWGLNANRDPQAIPTPLIGKTITPFQLPALDEPTGQLDNSLFEGQVTLLNFWGSWCYVCIDEHPFLNQLAKQGVRIIGANYRDSRSAAVEWLEQRGNPYQQVIFDAEGRFAIDLGVYGAPETFLVDKRGVIRYKRVGRVDADLWRRKIAPLYQQLLAE